MSGIPTTARELTRVLRASGALEHGEVVRAEMTASIETPVSQLSFIEIGCAEGSRPELPRSLVVKCPLDDSPAPDRGGAETAFYRELAPRLPSPPIARCLATAPPQDGRQWLVLEDLRATTGAAAWPEKPTELQLEQSIDVLARLHAQWWDAHGTGIPFGTPNDEASLRGMVAGVAAHLPAFLDDLGGDLSLSDRVVLESVFHSSLAPWLRLVDPRGLTIIHGDAHSWNFLFDRAGLKLPYLIDWQTWHQDVGARDLAFLMALHWDAPTRQRLERPLLERYHRESMERGVAAYSFDDLLLDYRRCVVRNLTFPIIFWSRKFPRERWRYRLDCALAAFRDWNAAELI